VALRLGDRYRITVLTTCAQDYLTWGNHYPPGESADGPLRVLRFPVVRERRVRSFGRLSVRLFSRPHRFSEEAEWMERQGPDVPALGRHLEREAGAYDLVLFFTYLYATTFFNLPLVASRAVLVPMAHPEEQLALGIFRYVFHLPRGFLFNTPEERDLVQGTFGVGHLPWAIGGFGIDLPPADPPPPTPGIPPRYLFYLGRIDIQKGVGELFDFFQRYLRRRPDSPLHLILAGTKAMEVPRHGRIRWAGYVPAAVKESLLAHAEAVVVPSPYESLSISALEAWAHGRPVLACGRSGVLDGQCRRSGGGLLYRSYDEFEAALDQWRDQPAQAAAMGAEGRRFVERTATWPVVTAAYVSFLEAMRTAVAGA
jgi:glycosyltransferase involved in cell wall biosynthesis